MTPHHDNAPAPASAATSVDHAATPTDAAAPAGHAAVTSDLADLLDQPPLVPGELAAIEEQVAALLGTADDVVILQAEAIALLEGVARSLAAPDAVAINVVTGPYGALFGEWMRAGGATVADVVSEFDGVAVPAAVEKAFAEHPDASILALVHAEAATGGTNPVAEIVAIGRAHAAVVVLDAVASIGAEPVLPAEWGVDVTVIGGQKSLAGPAGISAAAVSDRAWAMIDANPVAPRASFLSLVDYRDGWTRAGRTAILGTPNVLETRALGQALTRVAAEGTDAVIDRHTRARAAILAAAAELGLEPWQQTVAGAAPVVTTLRRPAGYDATAGLGGIVSVGNGPLAEQLLRVNHTGRRAALDDVVAAVRTLGAGIAAPAERVDAAVASAGRAWG